MYEASAHAGATIKPVPTSHINIYNKKRLMELFTSGKNSLSFARVIIV
jgi:hypothetical protein